MAALQLNILHHKASFQNPTVKTKQHKQWMPGHMILVDYIVLSFHVNFHNANIPLKGKIPPIKYKYLITCKPTG